MLVKHRNKNRYGKLFSTSATSSYDGESWKRELLCISTSKQVVHKLYAGQNHIFWHFNIIFHQKLKKQEKGKM